MNPTNYPLLKRWVSLSLMLVMTALMSYGYDFVVDGLAYKKHADGTTVGVTWLDGDSYTGIVRYPSLYNANIPEKVTNGGVTYTVTAIECDAFNQAESLRKVVIPNSVTTIGELAFYGCTNLENVTIGESVEVIGEEAFRSCWKLKSIVIPNSVSLIDLDAFAACGSMTSLTIGKNVKIIRMGAFYNCNRLSDVYCHLMDPQNTQCDVEIFGEDVPSPCTLHVPNGTKELYMACEPWSQFENIVDDFEPGGDFQPWIQVEPQIQLNVGDSHQLTALTNPADMALSWMTSDEAIAIVDQTGLVTAVAPGVAVITVANSETGGPSATCNVCVNNVDNTIYDVNHDGKIDIADLNQFVNVMLGKTGYDIPTGNNNGNDTAPGKKK